MLVVTPGNKIKINFLFIYNGDVYDPTTHATPSDVFVGVVRGDNVFSSVILNPISYLFTSATPDPNTYIEKISNSQFCFNYTVPQNFFPGIYTAVAKTFRENEEITIESRFQVKENENEPFSTVPLGSRSSRVNFNPSYEDLNASNMESILLVGHGDGIELNSPVKIRSVQHAIDLLSGDFDSPLIRGVFDAYGAGAKNIFICATAPMLEYVEDIEERLVPASYLNLESATPIYQTFYQKYYERLSETYSILTELDFIDIIVPLEVSMISTGGIDFVTQLANYLDDFHNQTGNVQIGVMGSKTNGISSQDIALLEANPVLVNKLTTVFMNQITSDKGRYIFPVYGEAVFSHSQVDLSYSNSVSAAVAGMISQNPLNTGMIRKRIPGALSLYGVNLNSPEMARLEAIGINTIYRGNKARRSQSYQVYLSDDFTLASKNSVYNKLPQIRLVSYIASMVKDYGYQAVGKFGYDRIISSVNSLLTSLKKDRTIVDFEFKAESNPTDLGVITLYINIISSLGLKKINLSLSAGPGA
jgi:hypothetical protein